MNHLSPQRSADGRPSPKRRRQSSPALDGPRELGQMRAHRDAGSGSANFVGSGSGIHFVRTVRRAFASSTAKQTAMDRDGDAELVPGEDDRLDSPSTLWRGDEISFQGHQNTPSPVEYEFNDLVKWTKSYFESWHPPFPFLHAPSVLDTLEKLSMSGFAKLTQSETVIVRSIMSISMADRRQLPKQEGCLVPHQLVFSTTDDSISTLQTLIMRPSTLSNLQAVVSVQVFLISMLRLNAASRIGGLIVRMAFHLGLHRCPARFEQFSPAEVDIRRRLFWSIYSLERYLSQSLGLPLDLKDDDLDVCNNDNEIHEASTAVTSPAEVGATIDSKLLLPTFLAKHGRIKGLILEVRNKSVMHSHSDPEELSRIDAEISQWWNEAQDLIDPDLDSDGFNGQERTPLANLKASHKLLLIVQKHESVILLNRPVISSGSDTAAFAAAMQKCIGASKAIVTNLYRHISKSIEMEGARDGRIKYPLLWPGFVWLVWQSGLILLYAASEGYYSDQVAQKEASRCVGILENLALRGTIWPSSCASVIRELQSALKMQRSSGFALNGRGNSSTRALPPLERSANSRGAELRPPIIHSSQNGIAGIDRNRLAFPIETPRPYTSSAEEHPLEHQYDSRMDNSSDFSYRPSTATMHQSPQDSSTNFAHQEISHISPVPGTPFQNQATNSEYFTQPFGSGNWPNVQSSFGVSGDQQDGLYDIFQLMDPSSLVNEYNSAQSLEMGGNFGAMPFFGTGAGYQPN